MECLQRGRQYSLRTHLAHDLVLSYVIHNKTQVSDTVDWVRVSISWYAAFQCATAALIKMRRIVMQAPSAYFKVYIPCYD